MIRPAGRVRTLMGSGLFDFGDHDGPGAAVRMQHVRAMLDRRTLLANKHYNTPMGRDRISADRQIVGGEDHGGDAHDG